MAHLLSLSPFPSFAFPWAFTNSFGLPWPNYLVFHPWGSWNFYQHLTFLTFVTLGLLVARFHFSTSHTAHRFASSLLDLQHTSSHAYDFEIPLKSFKSPLVVDLVTTTSTTPDLEFLQRILPIEDLIELWIQNPRSTIRGTKHTLFSLLMIIFRSPKKEEA